MTDPIIGREPSGADEAARDALAPGATRAGGGGVLPGDGAGASAAGGTAGPAPGGSAVGAADTLPGATAAGGSEGGGAGELPSEAHARGESDRAARRRARRLRRFDSPWLDPRLLWGSGILLAIVLVGVLGRGLWNTEMVYTGSAPLKLPPVGFENLRKQPGVAAHPLGTDGSGRDMLSLIIVGAPNSLLVGIVASTIGMTVGIVLGFSAGFIGGRVDDVIRVLSDVMITIPPLLILVVVQASFGDVSLLLMALLIAGFVWQSPTRLIRAQVLSMRESGYVQMARLSGASTFDIMFREMMPNLVPYLFGSFIASVTTSIVTAVGLEVLGLGPQRIPTLGRTIYEAINSGALIQNLWWWWGIPTLLLSVMFVALLLINIGLDEISNPRLRKA